MSLPPEISGDWPASTEDRLELLAEKLKLKWCDECGDWEHYSGESMEISMPIGNPEPNTPGPM